jgi:hypothetical protein
MELLGDVGLKSVSVHLETVLVSVQGFALNVPQALELFWMHTMVLLGDEAQVEARFGPFGDVLILTQD